MKILIPVDGSDCSKETLTWAAQTLSKEETHYYLLHVLQPIPDMVMDYNNEEAACIILDEAKERLAVAGCHIEKTSYATGDPADVINRYAKELNVDQVLIGSHGRSGLLKLLLGSVSSKVLETCPKPVFVYRNVVKEPMETMTRHKMI